MQKRLRECVDAAQKEHVVVTRHGRPAAIVIGIEGHDWEDVFYETSADFWRLIAERRRGKTVPLEELRKRLEARWARKSAKARAKD
jgi:prevent-host-death family protein